MQGDDNQKLFALDTMKGLSLTSWKKDLINLFENGSNEIKGKLLIMTSKHSNIISNEMIYPIINNTDELLASKAIISFGIRKNYKVSDELTEFIEHKNQIIRAAACASMPSETQRALTVVARCGWHRGLNHGLMWTGVVGGSGASHWLDVDPNHRT